MIHVFIGTKAQYIKTAPVIQRLDAEGIPYRLIDSGQHAAFSREIRRELAIREPDVRLREGADIASIPRAFLWMLRWTAAALFRRRRVREEIFGGRGGVCLIHGDTPTTLLSVILARRAGLRVAHLEAGLRSYSYIAPFPEELFRVLAMKMSHILFAPTDEAFANLERMRLRGDKYHLGVNTGYMSLMSDIEQRNDGGSRPDGLAGGRGAADNGGYCLAAIHRVETLHRKRRLRMVVDLATRIAADRRVVFILHPPTEHALRRQQLIGPLEECAGVELLPLVPHREFVRLLRGCDFVVTDGGSIQEESYYLNVPCLLLRERTERPEGLGDNVCLSAFEDEKIDHFLRNVDSFRAPPFSSDHSPVDTVIDRIREYQ